MAFIYDTWLNSFFDVGANLRSLRRIDFKTHHRDVIQKCLSRGQTLVACDPEMSELIRGYICFERIGAQICVHYCYVRGSQRKLGIGRRLYHAVRAIAHDDDLPVIISHITPHWNYIDADSVYIPYAQEDFYHAKIISGAVRQLSFMRGSAEGFL